MTPKNKYSGLVSRLSKSQQQRLSTYLDCLPDRHRTAAMMALAGKKQKEIAAKLSVSQPVVCVMLRKVFEAIAEIERETKC